MDVVDAVQRQEARLFEQVLPAFIARFFRGDGHELLFHLKSAAAARSLAAIADCGPPSDAALERARFVRVNCPVRFATAALEAGLSGVTAHCAPRPGPRTQADGTRHAG